MIVMIMMMKMITAVTQPIFKLGPPDFAWQQIWLIPTDDDDDEEDDDNDDNNDSNDNDNDSDDDDENGNCHNSISFQARISIFCMLVDLDNIYR